MLRSAWDPELPPSDRVPLYCMWMRGLCDLGELRQAAALAARACEEFPDEPDVAIAQGNVDDQRGELEGARVAFQRAIELSPAGSLQHYNLGSVLERLGDDQGAVDCYRQAIEIEEELPGMFEACAALGAVLRRMGRLEEAAEVYETYLEEDPVNPEMLVEHGICLSDLERFGEAVERFRLCLSLEPGHPGSLYNLGVTYYRMGNNRQALATMRRAYEAEPTNPLTRAVFGAWSLGTGRDDEIATSHLMQALELLTEQEGFSSPYAKVVVDEVFDALWHAERKDHAREIARWAGQRDWVTTQILDTINGADNGRTGSVTAYRVTARARAGQVPEHWPGDAEGYTADLTVLASDETEAREFTLRYLEGLEPGVEVQIDAVGCGGGDTDIELPAHCPARGVVAVNGSRAFFRN